MNSTYNNPQWADRADMKADIDHMIMREPYNHKQNNISIIDRNGNEHKLNRMIMNEKEDAKKFMEGACNVTMLPNIFGGQSIIGLSDFQCLQELLRLCVPTRGHKDDFDLEMARKAIIIYLALEPRQRLVRVGKQFVIKGEDAIMNNTIHTGTKVIDRNGKEFMAYSYKLTDYNKAMELLGKVNVLDVAENLDEGYDSMIEILYRALDKKVKKSAIKKDLDADFALKVIRIYFGLAV